MAVRDATPVNSDGGKREHQADGQFERRQDDKKPPRPSRKAQQGANHSDPKREHDTTNEKPETRKYHGGR